MRITRSHNPLPTFYCTNASQKRKYRGWSYFWVKDSVPVWFWNLHSRGEKAPNNPARLSLWERGRKEGTANFKTKHTEALPWAKKIFEPCNDSKRNGPSHQVQIFCGEFVPDWLLFRRRQPFERRLGQQIVEREERREEGTRCLWAMGRPAKETRWNHQMDLRQKQLVTISHWW